MNEFAQILEDAGGAVAPPEQAARLRTALLAELARGADELAQPRSGYESPVLVAFAPGLAVVPVPSAARADPALLSDRAWLLVAAAVGSLIEAGGGGLEGGEWDGWLVLVAAEADAELAVLAFEEQVTGVDRLRAAAVEIPPIAAPQDVRPPVNPMLAVAAAVARKGGRPADQEQVEERTEAARPHDDPDPSLRAARRILQRLRGMGKWGGYHTDFAHLAKGFPGHEKQLAFDVGEALLLAGLLAEKPSVGQRHVYLDPRRAGDIHALVDHGVTPDSLRLP
jgi:hypothetical protein